MLVKTDHCVLCHLKKKDIASLKQAAKNFLRSRGESYLLLCQKNFKKGLSWAENSVARARGAWVLEQRAAGRGLSAVPLCFHAQVIAKKMNINDFPGGPSWCCCLMSCNHLSVPAQTSMCQKLPPDFQAKVDSFHCSRYKKEVTVHSVLPDHVRNMDEAPLVFDIPISQSVTEKRQKSTSIVTASHEMLVRRSSFFLNRRRCQKPNSPLLLSQPQTRKGGWMTDR